MENLDQSNTNNKSLSLIAEYGASDSDSDDTETRSNDHTGTEDSDAADLSEMVLKNNIINACAHGPIARANPLEVLDTTRHMIIDPAQSGVVEYQVTEYRNVDSSSSSDSDSEVDSVKDVEEVSSGDEGDKAAPPVQPKVAGELGLDELPPIEDLAISLPAEQTTKIGTIASIVDRLVIVRGLPETPAVDLDSVLFLENGAKTLGKVFDVFGPVTEPHYCVRFNSLDHVKERGVAAGMDVFVAPRTPHTSYVFVADLMKIKGSDASWLNDIEPPSHQVEYSDDEEERRAKAVRKEHNRQQREQTNPQAQHSEGDTARNLNIPQRRNPPVARIRPLEFSIPFGRGRGRAQLLPNRVRDHRPTAGELPIFGYARLWESTTTSPHPDFDMYYPNHNPFMGSRSIGNHNPFMGSRSIGNHNPFMGSRSIGNLRMASNSLTMNLQRPRQSGRAGFGRRPQPQWDDAPPPPPGT